MEFVDWPVLGTYTGALTMVITITQITKNAKFIKKIPTQLWSYLVALAVLFPAYHFTDQLTLSNAVLIMFNAALIALAANGGFDVISRAFPDLFAKNDSGKA
jgi:hypothetical protein